MNLETTLVKSGVKVIVQVFEVVDIHHSQSHTHGAYHTNMRKKSHPHTRSPDRSQLRFIAYQTLYAISAHV
jgi:hypothetical protein